VTERGFLRFGGGAAMVGAVLGLVFNVLHPRTGDIDNVRAEIETVADSGIWVFDHFMLAWAIAFSFVGFLALTLYLGEGGGGGWVWAARGTVVIGVAVTFVTLVVDGMAIKEVADNWAEATGPAKAAAFSTAEAVAQVSLALFTGTIGTLFGLAPALIGAAGLATRRLPTSMSYAWIVAGGVGLLAASIQFLAGPSSLTVNGLFLPASLLATVLLFLGGWTVWNAAAEPATTVAPTRAPVA
jgi:hypothetical protein